VKRGHIVATVFLATVLAIGIAFYAPGGFAETTNVPPVVAQQTEENFFNHGNAEKDKGDLNGAIADLTKVIEFAPKAPEGYSYRAGVKAIEGDLAVDTSREAPRHLFAAGQEPLCDDPQTYHLSPRSSAILLAEAK
jgi:hypothetical protein